ncbi:MAG: RNA pseudouridine synthase [Nitrospiraceae bacterium]|nr:RNA pseudouridine synthase [Nitrospiraceae bacterium]
MVYLKNIEVVYEDNHLLIVSKPACVPTVPDSSGDTSLLDWGKMYLKRTRNKPGNVFLGVVHRLDRPVSGIVCFAVTSKAASRLSEQLRTHMMTKTYLAMTKGKPPSGQGILEHMLKKDRARNIVHICPKDAGGKFAKTSWKLLGTQDGISLLELRLATGRPHQLRVQCASMGCPLLGDVKYGAKDPLPDLSIGLHAYRMRLLHPTRRQWLELSDLPHESGTWGLYKGLYHTIS